MCHSVKSDIFEIFIKFTTRCLLFNVFLLKKKKIAQFLDFFVKNNKTT